MTAATTKSGWVWQTSWGAATRHVALTFRYCLGPEADCASSQGGSDPTALRVLCPQGIKRQSCWGSFGNERCRLVCYPVAWKGKEVSSCISFLHKQFHTRRSFNLKKKKTSSSPFTMSNLFHVDMTVSMAWLRGPTIQSELRHCHTSPLLSWWQVSSTNWVGWWSLQIIFLVDPIRCSCIG